MDWNKFYDRYKDKKRVFNVNILKDFFPEDDEPNEEETKEWEKRFNSLLPSWIRYSIKRKDNENGVSYKLSYEVIQHIYIREYRNKNHIETFQTNLNGCRYNEKNGTWSMLNENVLQRAFRSEFQTDLGKYGIEHISDINKILNPSVQPYVTSVYNPKIENPVDAQKKKLVAFRNGTFNFETGTLEKHKENNYLFNTHNYEISEGETPETDSLLNAMMGEESALFLKEFIGYCFYHSYDIAPLIVFFHGEGGEGKSELFNYITGDIIGEDNRASVSPQTLSSENDRFAGVDLYLKEINAYDDLNFQEMKDVGVLKSLTGNGSGFRVQQKGEKAFKMQNYAKCLWSCNRLPMIDPRNIDRALTDRLNVIEFINGDTRNENKEFWIEHSMDKVKAEKPMFVYKCLMEFTKVYHKHFEKGGNTFDVPDVVKKNTAKWLGNSDKYKLFIDDMAEHNTAIFATGTVDIKSAFKEYQNWCEENKFQAIGTRISFQEGMKRNGWEYRELNAKEKKKTGLNDRSRRLINTAWINKHGTVYDN